MLCQLLFVILCLTVTSCQQDEGDSCIKNGIQGTCINIRKCPSAQEDIRNRKRPQICMFDGSDPVVCCVNRVPVATPSIIMSQSTTEYVPIYYDYISVAGKQIKPQQCEPIERNLTSSKTGQKAWDKCIEYQEQFVYPCEESQSFTRDLFRNKKCFYSVDELIVGGTDAKKGEFPHMVLLGFGNDRMSAKWLCGGTLLSDRFILTAGHCIYSRKDGKVTFAALGIMKREDIVSSNKIYRIKTIVKHPEYVSPQKYNDIALLETEIQMNLDRFSFPACLDVGKETRHDKASATGWGAVLDSGNVANSLQKVTLKKFSEIECSNVYPKDRLMSRGIVSNTQICYGDQDESKDTCQGDSGGPLQIKSKHIHCTYTVIGVTSFGNKCGDQSSPGIFTKVAAFVPWIESIVWP